MYPRHGTDLVMEVMWKIREVERLSTDYRICSISGAMIGILIDPRKVALEPG
jgi:hypothetical protein